jgi:hypothetical protein
MTTTRPPQTYRHQRHHPARRRAVGGCRLQSRRENRHRAPPRCTRRARAGNRHSGHGRRRARKHSRRRSARTARPPDGLEPHASRRHHACGRSGPQLIDISVPASDQHLHSKLQRDRAWLLTQIGEHVRLARDLGFGVGIGAEDASRGDPELLAAIAEAAQSAGAQRIRFADTLGVLDPFATFERIRHLRACCDLEIEMHAHDDLGMATANTLAAACAGATHLNTTVNGLGERSGNAPLEEVVLGLHVCHGIETGIDLAGFPDISGRVAIASGRPCAGRKALSAKALSPTRPASTSMACSRTRPTTRASIPVWSAASIASCSASIPEHAPCNKSWPASAIPVGRRGSVQALLPAAAARLHDPPQAGALRGRPAQTARSLTR